MTMCCRIDDDGKVLEIFGASKAGLVKTFTAELLESELWIEIPGEVKCGWFYHGKGAAPSRIEPRAVETKLVAKRMLKEYGVVYSANVDIIMTDDWRARKNLWDQGYDPDIILSPTTFVEKAKNLVGL